MHGIPQTKLALINFVRAYGAFQKNILITGNSSLSHGFFMAIYDK